MSDRIHELWLALGLNEDAYQSWNEDGSGRFDIMIERANQFCKYQESINHTINNLINAENVFN